MIFDASRVLPCALPRARRLLVALLTIVAAAGLGGCRTVINTVTEDFAGQLSTAILDNPDLATVRDGAPAYLILIDGLLGTEPSSPELLKQAALLNSSYATAFVEEPERSRLLNAKALSLSEQSVCLGIKNGCDLRSRPFAEYEAWLAGLRAKDVPLAYGLGASWAGWLQANSDDFAAIAELGRVKALMARMLELEPSFDNGGPHLYMGVFETLLPPSVGGRPEVAKAHFESALEIAGESALMVKVLYAEQYARAQFDRELHDKLLAEVLRTNPQVSGLTLTNTLAQERAKALMETADAYF